MHVLTHASIATPGLQRFLASCERAELRPLVLGYGQLWRGFGCRLRRVTAALAGLSGPVLFLDAFDVLCFGTAAEIEARYRAFGSPLVVAAETICYPWPERAAEYPSCPTRYPYLNAGAWIGEAEYVRSLFRAAGADQVPDETNDQGWLTDLFLADPTRLRLDTGCELFMCLTGAEGDVVRLEGQWRNRLTGTAPLIFHGNGGAAMEFLEQ
jgi:hypothetical protein